MFQVTRAKVFKEKQEQRFTETREKIHTFWDIKFLGRCAEYLRS